MPVVALLFPALLLFCAIPLASYRAYFAPVYLIPAAALAYVLVTSTTVTATTVTARTLLARHRLSWSDLAGFEFRGPRWALAVTTSGRRFRLPMVRPRDLPLLAAVSGGRLNLRTAAAAESEPPPEPDPVPDLAYSEVTEGSGPPDTVGASDPSAEPGTDPGANAERAESASDTGLTAPVDAESGPAAARRESGTGAHDSETGLPDTISSSTASAPAGAPPDSGRGPAPGSGGF